MKALTKPLFPVLETETAPQPKTKDEREYLKEKRRNRKNVTPLKPAPASGPCCFRCRAWRAPVDEKYGRCWSLGIADESKTAFGITQGTIVAIADADRAGIYAEPLHTGPAFVCSLYRTEEAA